MAKYRKKCDVFEAMQSPPIGASLLQRAEFNEWTKSLCHNNSARYEGTTLIITTKEHNDLVIHPASWLICDQLGNLSRLQSEVFAAIFELDE